MKKNKEIKLQKLFISIVRFGEIIKDKTDEYVSLGTIIFCGMYAMGAGATYLFSSNLPLIAFVISSFFIIWGLKRLTSKYVTIISYPAEKRYLYSFAFNNEDKEYQILKRLDVIWGKWRQCVIICDSKNDVVTIDYNFAESSSVSMGEARGIINFKINLQYAIKGPFDCAQLFGLMYETKKSHTDEKTHFDIRDYLLDQVKIRKERVHEFIQRTVNDFFSKEGHSHGLNYAVSEVGRSFKKAPDTFNNLEKIKFDIKGEVNSRCVVGEEEFVD